jgi:methionyl-tRNA formyltransferase
MSKLRVVFMGTPEFSVGILDAIMRSQHEVVGVVTVADKPAGRGQVMHESAVKVGAMNYKVPVLQPVSLKDESFISELKALNADVFVVVAFRMLPEIVWKMPEKGTFNLHASLLPDYRGAAPINWSIINGDTKTGLSTFFIDEQIDTGSVILQKELSISENENAGSLHDRMIPEGGKLVVETLDLIASGNVATIPQREMVGSMNRPAPKLFKENTKIDWNADIKTVHQLICGLSPYPASWSVLTNTKGELKTVKFFETRVIHTTNKLLHEMWSTKDAFYIQLKDGVLEVLEWQMEGKKRMTTRDWLVGNQISDWKINQ